MALRASRAVAIAIAIAVSATGFLANAIPAQAVVGATFVVDTALDSDPANACTDSSVTSLSSPITLRSAICAADNAGTATVQLPNLTFTLSPANGALVFGTGPGKNITIHAAPGASPTIVGDGAHQIFTLDPSTSGGVAVTLDGLTVKGGVDNVYGGGALIGGSSSAATADSLTILNSTFSANQANPAGGPMAGSTAHPGGAVQFVGGALTVTNSTFTGNSSGDSPGGAIAYQAMGTVGEQLAISGSTFSNNSTTNSSGLDNGGAAIVIDDTNGTASLSIDSSSFTDNTANGSPGNPARGSAIWQRGGNLHLSHSTVTGNVNAGWLAGAAIDVTGGALTADFNRITGNTGTALGVTGATAVAQHNWWGCAKGPGNAGCGSVTPNTASVYSPFLTLTVAANPALILSPATSTALTAGLLTDSAGKPVAPTSLTAFDGLPVAWSSPTPTPSSVSSPSSTLSGGTTGVSYLTNGAKGAGSVSAALDGSAVSAPVGIAFAPTYSSGQNATAVVGASGTFLVQTSGYPVPALSILAGSLPSGLTFTDLGNGSATIAGTPNPGTAGAYAVDVSAVNAVTTVHQSLTLNVLQSPAITSATSTTFAAGSADSFAVTTTGQPVPSPITLTGILPSGVTFTDNGDGTASLDGTPGAGTGGVYPVTIAAVNAVTSSSQSFTLTVTEPVAITSAAAGTATVGSPFTFTVTTSHGFPAATTISSVGTLPPNATFHDNGNGTATIAGTPAAGTGGVYAVTLTATNGTAPASQQTFTLTTLEVPVITTAAAAQVVNAGNPVAFTAGASGYPTPTVEWSVSTDGGATFAPITGATSTTLSFTAAQSDNGNHYRATFTNTAGSIDSDATLTVGTSPSFSNAASATFLVGSGLQNATVTATGIPSAALSLTGPAPAWLTLTDSGSGNGKLSGIPPAGSHGQYQFTLHATNGFSPDATQTFTLTVNESVAFSSASSAAFAVGSLSSFTMTTTAGFPVATQLTQTGTLPHGVTFVDNGDGTATLAGTPVTGSGGVYPLTISAGNPPAPSASQSFVLTVTEAPSFTSASSTTVTRGVDESFTVHTGHSYPATTSLTTAGTLPAGLTIVDNGDGSASIHGSTVDAAAGIPLTLTAHAGPATATQSFTLAIVDAPIVTLPPLAPTGSGPLGGVPATVVAGQQLTVTASGFAPDAPVTFGIYSTPTVLTVVNADLTGSATATVTIPAGLTGAHTLVAGGIAPDGSTRFLRTGITLPAAQGGTGTGTAGAAGTGDQSTTGGLPDTGLDIGGLVALSILLLGAGAAVAFRRRMNGGVR